MGAISTYVSLYVSCLFSLLFREEADALTLSSSRHILCAFMHVRNLAIQLLGHLQLKPAELLKDFKFLLAISLQQEEKNEIPWAQNEGNEKVETTKKL